MFWLISEDHGCASIQRKLLCREKVDLINVFKLKGTLQFLLMDFIKES